MTPLTLPRLALQAAQAVLPARHVGVHGFYGARNVGDDAILDATIQSVRGLGLDPLVVAWEPGAVRDDLGVRAISARGGQKPLWLAMRHLRAFVLGGGGLIKDHGASPDSLAHWMRGLRLASDLGVPTMTWSVGAQALQFSASERRVRETLERVDVVTVRDPESAQSLRDLGLARDVVVTADPVPAYAVPFRTPPPENERPHVVVAMRHWADEGDRPDGFDRFAEAVATGLDALVGSLDAEVTFIPLRARPGDDDRRAGAAVAARMDAPATVADDPEPTAASTIRHLQRADVVVSMRLHGAVLASALGVPTVGLSYAPKVASYMRQIGMEDYCRDLDEVEPGWLVERVGAAHDRRADLRRDLLAATNRLAEAYRENERLLCSLVSA